MRKRTLNTDPIAYRVDYSRVAQELHYLRPSKEPSSPDSEKPDKLGPRATMIAEIILGSEGDLPIDLPQTGERALALIERARRELLRLGWRHPGRKPRWYVRVAHWRFRNDDLQLGKFLDAVLEPATVVVYFSTRVEAGEPIGPFEGKASLEQVDRKEGSAADPAWLGAYLDRLVSFDAPPAKGRLRSFWDGLRWKRPKGINYRVRYNVACMFSRIASRSVPEEKETTAATLELAALHLERCVSEAHGRQRRALIDWAWADPGLEGLRRMDSRRFASALALPDAPREAS